MQMSRKEFGKLAVSMGVANRTEIRIFFSEFPKDEYEDDKDMIHLWRMVQQCRKMKHLRRIQQGTGVLTRTCLYGNIREI